MNDLDLQNSLSRSGTAPSLYSKPGVEAMVSSRGTSVVQRPLSRGGGGTADISDLNFALKFNHIASPSPAAAPAAGVTPALSSDAFTTTQTAPSRAHHTHTQPETASAVATPQHRPQTGRRTRNRARPGSRGATVRRGRSGSPAASATASPTPQDIEHVSPTSFGEAKTAFSARTTKREQRVSQLPLSSIKQQQQQQQQQHTQRNGSAITAGDNKSTPKTGGPCDGSGRFRSASALGSSSHTARGSMRSKSDHSISVQAASQNRPNTSRRSRPRAVSAHRTGQSHAVRQRNKSASAAQRRLRQLQRDGTTKNDASSNGTRSLATSESAKILSRKELTRQHSFTYGTRQHFSPAGEQRPPCRQKDAFPVYLADLDPRNRTQAFVADTPASPSHEAQEHKQESLWCENSARPPSRHKPPEEALFLDGVQQDGAASGPSASPGANGPSTDRARPDWADQRHDPEADGFAILGDSGPCPFRIEVTNSIVGAPAPDVSIAGPGPQDRGKVSASPATGASPSPRTSTPQFALKAAGQAQTFFSPGAAALNSAATSTPAIKDRQRGISAVSPSTFHRVSPPVVSAGAAAFWSPSSTSNGALGGANVANGAASAVAHPHSSSTPKVVGTCRAGLSPGAGARSGPSTAPAPGLGSGQGPIEVGVTHTPSNGGSVVHTHAHGPGSATANDGGDNCVGKSGVGSLGARVGVMQSHSSHTDWSPVPRDDADAQDFGSARDRDYRSASGWGSASASPWRDVAAPESGNRRSLYPAANGSLNNSWSEDEESACEVQEDTAFRLAESELPTTAEGDALTAKVDNRGSFRVAANTDHDAPVVEDAAEVSDDDNSYESDYEYDPTTAIMERGDLSPANDAGKLLAFGNGEFPSELSVQSGNIDGEGAVGQQTMLGSLTLESSLGEDFLSLFAPGGT